MGLRRGGQSGGSVRLHRRPRADDYWPEAPRISVSPGTYRARVYFGGVYAVSVDEFEGEGHYRAALWPGQAEMPKVLHSRGTGRW